ncbi:MAG: 4a-hydroxytetrahydrobiopterin dehydratase [Actinobacteria bacterium]|uniref:4a-hydroxytetrahydrobiopterin dehydratase n=1 Tax=freshwater metagenome TaxID=449393 RepID=A0A6J6GX17_9ZZZZ|nr:4a-hydroxytetrahydrobiopterin dehydratase [Actinomycetota bacterium]
MADAWVETDGALYRKFSFNDFAEAFAFMTRVAAIAEAQNHHPDWSNSWNTVEISLRSHDKGAITQRDHQLAKAIDEILI